VQREKKFQGEREKIMNVPNENAERENSRNAGRRKSGINELQRGPGGEKILQEEDAQ